MAGTLSQLFVTLDLKSDAFISGIRDSQKEAKELQKSLEPLTKAVGDVGKAMVGIGAAISAAAAPFALMAKSAIDSADALSKMAQRTGVSIQTLSALKVQAELADVSMESLATAMKKSSAVLENAATGSKTAEESLRKLGLSATDLFKLNPDQRFFAIASAIESIADPTVKAALAQEILGKSGTDLLTLLPTLASQGIDGVTKSAREMGKVMTEQGGKSAEAFNDAITHLSQSFTGLFTAIANSGLLEKITGFINKIADLVSGFGQAHPQLLAIGAAVGALAIVIGPVVAAIGLVVTGISALVGPATAVIGSITGIVSGFGGVLGIGSAVVALLTGPVGIVIGIGAALAAIIAFRKEIAGALLTALSAMVQGWANMVGGLAKVADALGAKGIAGSLRDVQTYLTQGAEKTYLLGQSMVATTKATEEHTAAIQQVIIAKHDYVVKTSEQIEAEKKAKEAAEKFAAAIRDQVASIKGTGEESRKLIAVLNELEKQHVDMRLVVEKLGKASEDYAESLRLQGLAIPPVVQRVLEAKAAFEGLSEAMANAAKIIQDNRDKFADFTAGLIPAATSIDGLAQKIIDLNYELKKLKGPEFEIWRVEADRISGSFGDINAKLDEMSRVKIPDVAKATRVTASEIDKATKDIKESAGHIFDDMFIKGESVFGSLKNLLKGGALSLGRSIFEDVTAALLGPVKAAFDDFFKNTVANLIKGMLKPLTNWITSTLGGAIGSIGGPGGAPGVGVGVSVGGKFDLNNLLKGGLISGGIAAAGFGISKLIDAFGQGRKTADDFVQTLQNPFGQQLAQMADKFFAAARAGKLTADEAATASDAVAELWSQFQESANTFAKKGSTEAKVVKQAFDTLAFIPNQLLPDMTSVVSQLQQQTTDASDSLGDLAKKAKDVTTATDDTGDALSGLGNTIAKVGQEASDTFDLLTKKMAEAAAPLEPSTRNAVDDRGVNQTGVVNMGMSGIQNFTLSDITNAFNAWATQAAAMQGAGFNSQPFLWFGQPWKPGDPLPSSTVNLGLPSYQVGTDYVPATGPYMLHRGEQVVPEGQARQPISVSISVNALDTADFEKVVKTRIAPMLDKIVRHGGTQLTASRLHRS